ncbi:Hect e3 ubiquitin [Globisporangium polare]
MLGLLRTARLAPTAKLARAASTVGGALDEAVERLPHKEALRSIKQELRWSFKELNAIVDEVAFGLHSLKFEPGNVLAVWLPNNAESVITQLAAAKAGITLAVIDPKVSTAEEIEFILHDSKASGILFEPKIAGRNQTQIIQGLFPELATFREQFEVFRPKKFRNLHTVISTGFEPVEGIAQFHQVMVNTPEKHEAVALKKAVNEKTPLAVSYSKVDGQSPKKGDVLTHADVLKRAKDLAKSLTLTATDKILMTGEETALSFAPVAAIESSSLVVLASAEFDHEAIKHALKLEPCNIVGSGAANFKRV